MFPTWRRRSEEKEMPVDIRKKIVPAFSVSKMEEGGCPKAAPLFSGPAKGGPRQIPVPELAAAATE